MSSHYTTEPPPTATVLLHTTAGPLTVSLFASQTPLTCRNFLQHVLDGDYANNVFHRVSPGFVLQTGDPTGTGEGGHNIYEDREFERYDADWAKVMGREKDEKILFGDELHSRLKFNRRGLVGMAKGAGAETAYGSQFFITLGDCRAQLDGHCTMFGRVEGDGIYNVVKIAEGELMDGTERPLYPEKILRAEVLEIPPGDAWRKMSKRTRTVQPVVDAPAKKKAPKKKAGKALLSFGADEGDEGADLALARPKQAKFNPTLIDELQDPEPRATKTASAATGSNSVATTTERPTAAARSSIPEKRKASPPAGSRSPPPPSAARHRKPSFHDPLTQLPLRDPESPSRSPTPAEQPTAAKISSIHAEIAAVKASMRRNVAPNSHGTDHKKSALEALIPATSTRGRKRPRPGESNAHDDANALKMLNAFKARLESSDAQARRTSANGHAPSDSNHEANQDPPSAPRAGGGDDDDEATLCDLHFIANCQSCSRWDDGALEGGRGAADAEDDDRQWMSHQLSFAKDRLGKDLTWKKKNEEDLVVIDPRERGRELKAGQKRDGGKGRDKDKGKARDRRG